MNDPASRGRSRPIELLMVEDNPADARLTQELLAEAKVLNKLAIVQDGVEAIAHLRREPPYETATRPDVVLLDLNLPRMSGHEVLAAIKEDVRLKSIPVIVLTTSQAETDVEAAYLNQAAAFITKPVDLEQFIRMVQAILKSG